MSSVREATACLRCRARKIKCLGPVMNQQGGKSCEKCLKAHVNCEFVPHKRGRKIGTKLSEDVKASLKEKYALAHPNKCVGNKRRRSSSLREDNTESSEEQANGIWHGSQEFSRYQSTDFQNQPNSVVSSTYTYPTSNSKNQNSRTSYTSTVHQVLPTSSIRVNYAYQHRNDRNDQDNYSRDDENHNSGYNNQHDIGPSATKISSISRLFTIKKPKDSANMKKNNNGLSLFREDPITCGYIDEYTGKRLFELFMSKLANRVFIFDPELHTYDYVRNTSNFLFCVMLALAAKFDQSISRVIHKKCLALAKDQMLRVFADNIESEETVQALYVLTEYKEAEDENSYILLGMACRIAVDLDLASPRPDYDERRNRNRQRIWLVIFAADRRYNYCGQTAKPCMMPESSLSRNAAKFIDSPLCLIPDYRLAGNVELRRLLATHIEAIDRDNEMYQGSYQLDVGDEYREMEREADEWTKAQIASEPEMMIHAHLSALHAKVIIAHRWVQRLFRSNVSANTSRPDESHERDKREALGVCINGSLGILSVMLQLSDDTLRYACDSKHLYFAYASFFLHKIFDTNIASVMLDRQYITYFINLFERCAIRLEQVTVSETLTGAFHAAFLRSLMDICNQVLQDSSGSSEERSVSRRPSIGSLPTVVEETGPHNLENENITQELPPIFSENENSNNDILMSSLYNFDIGLENIPTIGNLLLEPSNEDLMSNINISWNDWWPFDNQTLGGEGSNGLNQFNGDNEDWQGSIQAS